MCDHVRPHHSTNMARALLPLLALPYAAAFHTPTRLVGPRHRASVSLCAPPPEPPDPDLGEEYEAGLAFGNRMRARFMRPTIDDPGLPYADALVCVCGASFVASIALVGIIPRPSWLVPLLPPGVEATGLRGLPYILPAVSHGAGLASCWTLGALAAAAFEAGAYRGTLREALGRTWRAGAFAVGVLLLSSQLDTSVSLSLSGVDPLGASEEADIRALTTAFEVLVDVAVQAVGLTAFRIFRWAEAQQYNNDRYK